jgi:malate permease and related proteins
MEAFFAVLWQNILPIFIVAGFGYALDRWQAIDKRTLSKVTLYILSPALVFASLVNSRLPGDELLGLSAFAIVFIGLMAIIAFLVGRLLRLPRRGLVTLMLVAMFGNTGNYGLTLINLRYGDDGLSRGVVFFAVSTMILYSAGILLASMGKLSARQALAQMLRLPPVYAAIGAIPIVVFNIPVPAPLMSAVTVAGQGAIPVMLLVLGMQISGLQGGFDWRAALPGTALRLFVAPLVALLVVGLLGLTGLSRATSILEASMPTAVIIIILATEFDLQPDLVTSIVVATTLLSPFTLAATIVLLGL